ncbi:MFS transporter [Streptomyces netropsis]|uniref:MFS family permease n=1 Tax=Streptomyces netropsis TaxID=55404 RepID=A0A7W7PC57_STRNE|nr:MFS transporter [Streptomyces netropsis]MBB4885321.1 MFS family permease [Streptomyces netropsis]GGR28300.1 hypothetical protein GCM10010219_36710 [Streptomyces netropsis]
MERASPADVPEGPAAVRRPVPDPGRWAVLAVLCSSLLLVAMDATILNVALPSLINDLEPGALEQLWIIDIYGLVLGGLLVTSGAVSDWYGRKRLFLSGFVLFGLASVVAATAGSSAQLIGGRVLLGLGGAMVMPSTLSLIRNIFTDAHERALAIGIWAAVAGAGACVGPVVGGVLVEHFGWSAAFWVNVTVVVVTVVAGLRLLPEYRTPQPGGLGRVASAAARNGPRLKRRCWSRPYRPNAPGRRARSRRPPTNSASASVWPCSAASTAPSSTGT